MAAVPGQQTHHGHVVNFSDDYRVNVVVITELIEGLPDVVVRPGQNQRSVAQNIGKPGGILAARWPDYADRLAGYTA